MAQTSSITMPSMVEIVGHTPAIDKKSVFYLSCFWNYEECDDNRNAIKQCNFQNNYGAIAQRKVCSCALIFKYFYGPQDFPLGENLYQKLRYHFWRFCGQQAHIFKATTVKFGVMVRT